MIFCVRNIFTTSTQKVFTYASPAFLSDFITKLSVFDRGHRKMVYLVVSPCKIMYPFSKILEDWKEENERKVWHGIGCSRPRKSGPLPAEPAVQHWMYRSACHAKYQAGKIAMQLVSHRCFYCSHPSTVWQFQWTGCRHDRPVLRAKRRV